MKSKHEPLPDYGYKINLNVPGMTELYYRFKKMKGIPRWCPLSDEERREFESYFLIGDDKNERAE